MDGEAASSSVEDEALERELTLERWALRFSRPSTERAYVAWQRSRTMGFNRAAIVAAVGGVFAGASALLLVRPHQLALALGPAVGLVAFSIALHRMTYRRAWDRSIHALIAVGNGLFGNYLVAANALLFGSVEMAAGSAVLTAFFAFAVNRTRPSYAALAVATYAGLALALLGRAASRGELGLDRAILESFLIAVSFASGFMVALIIDADGRRAYRQESIIEAQKRTIARERAKSEELLKRELSHQVAERSRDLGAALAKGDIVLDGARLVAGERFAERYRIVSELGAGGMGSVYEVERVTDGTRLAMKTVSGRLAGPSAARFAREAEIGARVRHPNLVSIVDVGVSSGVPFLVMELVRGGSLEGHRDRFGDVAWASPLLAQILEGLAALHDAGVVHRDLKPANVLIDAGAARISDFGISRFGALDASPDVDVDAATIDASAKRSASALTATGVVMGTPLYMAPEAAKSSRNLDASADVFAFGILAYEMLTGRSPFAVPAFMLALAEQPVPEPAPIEALDLPPAFVSMVLECFSTDPGRRPRVRALLESLTTTRSTR